MEVSYIVNSIFKSRTYFIREDKRAWIIDIGDIEPVLDYLNHNRLDVLGLFLTHAHFDHIYGLPSLINHFTNLKIYGTEYTKLALASEKLNMSKYHGSPIIYEGDNFIVVKEGDCIDLFGNGSIMNFYETPGHNPGCLTMVVGDLIFTGDAYIPTVGANTRVPHANKELAFFSMNRILKLSEGKTIYSGHQID